MSPRARSGRHFLAISGRHFLAISGRRARCALSGLAVTTLLLVTACHPCDGARVRILDAQGQARLDVCAEVATSEADRRAGLAGRSSLPAGAGLLMEFPVTGEVCITGEEMRFPIDVVFVSGTGHVAALGALGADDPALICEQGIGSVIEVSAGAARDVGVGDAVAVEIE